METKGVTCKIPLDLHEKISAEIRETESTLSRFIEKIIREHYEKGEIKGMAKERTLAFQVSEELFRSNQSVSGTICAGTFPQIDATGICDWFD